MSLLSIVKNYLKDIEQGMSGDDLKKYYSPNVQQIEFPNRLSPQGNTRDLSALMHGSENGKRVLSKQSLEITKAYEAGNTVIIEAEWRGTLALPIGQIPIGGEMKANFAQFYEFEARKIVRQRNYDCFADF